MEITNQSFPYIQDRLLALNRLLLEQEHWTANTFGTPAEYPPEKCIAHLGREVAELAAAPTDPEEYADCFLILVDAYRRAGGSFDSLIKNAQAKLDICKQRRYGPPDAQGVREHLRENGDAGDSGPMPAIMKEGYEAFKRGETLCPYSMNAQRIQWFLGQEKAGQERKAQQTNDEIPS